MSQDADRLRELSKKLVANPDAVYDLPEADVAELRKYMNPLGNVINAKKTYANLSIINWRLRDMRHLLMTSLVGYLFRLVEEYEPEELIEKAKEQIAGASAAEIAARCEAVTTSARGICRQFLNRHFNYNPDHHVRGSHSANPADPERIPRDELLRRKCVVAAGAEEAEARLRADPEATYLYTRSCLRGAYNCISGATETIAGAIRTLNGSSAGDLTAEDAAGILFRKHNALSEYKQSMMKHLAPINAAESLMALRVDPPADVFHHWDRYLTNNYEDLREICSSLYAEKPDFEYAVILYDTFKTAEAAKEHRVQHESEFRADVSIIENSGITLLGPFKENRDRIEFYNKNTEILKQMTAQMEADHKLGEDLMKKTVTKKKSKNIAEAGPDSPALAQYIKCMNTVQELGARRVLTQKEKEDMAAAKAAADKIKEDYAVPDDAIQVDVFYPTTVDGKTEISKTKFYTQAEPPLHLQEGSPYVSEYQPVRNEDDRIEESYTTKTVTTADGRKVEVKVALGAVDH